MNTFNRIVIVVSLLVLIPLVTVFLVIPHVILSDVGRWATDLGRQLWAADVPMRLGIGLLGALIFTVLALLLGWEHGVLFIGPIVAVMCLVSFFLFKPYPLGQPKKTEEAAA